MVKINPTHDWFSWDNWSPTTPVDPRLDVVGDCQLSGKLLFRDSGVQRLAVYDTPVIISPASNGFGFTKSGEKFVIATVPSLFHVASKPAIVGSVVTVVVLSLNSEFFGIPIAHSPGLECFKAIEPHIVHFDPTATVSTVVFGRTPVAPGNHPTPNAVETVTFEWYSYTLFSKFRSAIATTATVFPCFYLTMKSVLDFNTTRFAKDGGHTEYCNPDVKEVAKCFQ